MDYSLRIFNWIKHQSTYNQIHQVLLPFQETQHRSSQCCPWQCVHILCSTTSSPEQSVYSLLLALQLFFICLILSFSSLYLPFYLERKHERVVYKYIFFNVLSLNVVQKILYYVRNIDVLNLPISFYWKIIYPINCKFSTQKRYVMLSPKVHIICSFKYKFWNK